MDINYRKMYQRQDTVMSVPYIFLQTYMMKHVHRELFQVILTNVSSQDTEINKMRRNLKDINLNNLGVQLDFIVNIVPARKELHRLNSYSTPFGRMKCLKRVVSALCKPPKQQNLGTIIQLVVREEIEQKCIFTVLLFFITQLSLGL